MLSISFVLVTTLWCTILIVYRIFIVAGVKHGADGRLRVYQHFIEVLVESSALYSISLIVFMALVIRGDFGLYYLDAIAGIAKVGPLSQTSLSVIHTLCRELHPRSLLAEQQRDIRARKTTATKVQYRHFVSRRLRNFARLVLKKLLCRAQSLKWTLRLNRSR